MWGADASYLLLAPDEVTSDPLSDPNNSDPTPPLPMGCKVARLVRDERPTSQRQRVSIGPREIEFPLHLGSVQHVLGMAEKVVAADELSRSAVPLQQQESGLMRKNSSFVESNSQQQQQNALDRSYGGGRSRRLAMPRKKVPTRTNKKGTPVSPLDLSIDPSLPRVPMKQEAVFMRQILNLLKDAMQSLSGSCHSKDLEDQLKNLEEGGCGGPSEFFHEEPKPREEDIHVFVVSPPNFLGSPGSGLMSAEASQFQRGGFSFLSVATPGSSMMDPVFTDRDLSSPLEKKFYLHEATVLIEGLRVSLHPIQSKPSAKPVTAHSFSSEATAVFGQQHIPLPPTGGSRHRSQTTSHRVGRRSSGSGTDLLKNMSFTASSPYVPPALQQQIMQPTIEVAPAIDISLSSSNAVSQCFPPTPSGAASIIVLVDFKRIKDVLPGLLYVNKLYDTMPKRAAFPVRKATAIFDSGTLKISRWADRSDLTYRIDNLVSKASTTINSVSIAFFSREVDPSFFVGSATPSLEQQLREMWPCMKQFRLQRLVTRLLSPVDPLLFRPAFERIVESLIPRIIESSNRDFARLTAVELPSLFLQDDDCVAELMKCAPQLTVLNLRDNELGDATAEQLADALSEARRGAQTQKLVLGGNRISDAGAWLLAVAIKENRSLTLVDLSRNRILTSFREEVLAPLAVPVVQPAWSLKLHHQSEWIVRRRVQLVIWCFDKRSEEEEEEMTNRGTVVKEEGAPGSVRADAAHVLKYLSVFDRQSPLRLAL